MGYRYVCRREAVAMGGRSNTVWCLVKPLGEESLSAYLGAQTRDVQEEPPTPWLALES